MPPAPPRKMRNFVLKTTGRGARMLLRSKNTHRARPAAAGARRYFADYHLAPDLLGHLPGDFDVATDTY